MNATLTWKKRLVSLFVVTFACTAALPAFADPKTGENNNPDCKSQSDRKDNTRPASCHTVCSFDSKGNATGCRQVCN